MKERYAEKRFGLSVMVGAYEKMIRGVKQ